MRGVLLVAITQRYRGNNDIKSDGAVAPLVPRAWENTSCQQLVQKGARAGCQLSM